MKNLDATLIKLLDKRFIQWVIILLATVYVTLLLGGIMDYRQTWLYKKIELCPFCM